MKKCLIRFFNSIFFWLVICFHIIKIDEIYAFFPSKFQNGGIKGSVMDAVTGNALINANISIEGTSIGTTSDATGEFHLDNLSAGKYKLKATMIGYAPSSKTVIIKDSTHTVIFQLYPTVIKLNAITVIGEKYRNSIENPKVESPGLELATSSINQREIRKQGAKTLIDAVQYIPGAVVETRGRKVKQFFSVRGQKYPYPDYSVNGAWQREFHEMPYFFSSADIAKIEVIRSSAALLTGQTGLAGVVNIMPRQYDKSETSWNIEAGSFGTNYAHLSHGSNLGRLNYAFGVGFQQTDGPKNKYAAEKISNIYTNLSWNPIKNLSISLNLFYLYGKREMAQAEPPASVDLQTALESFDPLRFTLFSLRTFYKPSDRVSTELLFSYAHRTPVYVDENPITHEVARHSERDYEAGLSFIQSLSFFKNNILRVGGFFNHWIAPNGKRFYVGKRCDLTTYSAVIVDEHKFGSLHLDAGIKWARTYINEYGAFNIEGSAKGFGKVDPIQNEWEPSIFHENIGLAYYLNSSFTLNLNLASGEIQPQRGTLDLNLRAPENEHRFKLDLGTRITWDEIGQLSMTGFLTKQKNAIILSGQTQTVNDRIMELYLNRDQDQYGIEMEAKLNRLFNFAEPFMNFTYMFSRAEVAGQMEKNRDLPHVIANAGVFSQWKKFDLNIFGKYVSSFESVRFVSPTSSTPSSKLGDFFVADLTIGYSLGMKSMTRMYLEIFNLTDRKYSTVVGYPDFGRRFNLGIRQIFN